jgi:hypothetical protein
MWKKLIILICSISLLISGSTPTNASDSIRYKSTKDQIIKRNSWTTLNFNGKTSIKGNGERSLFCYQVVINTTGKKKPKYVKVRLARAKSGKDDTTATNTYFFSGKPSKRFVASQCWTILTNHPVVVQVRISGGSSSYKTDISQFKMWTPSGDYPEDFSNFIPETTIN